MTRELTIWEIGLSPTVLNGLCGRGITTVTALQAASDDELLSIRNIGPERLGEIRAALTFPFVVNHLRDIEATPPPRDYRAKLDCLLAAIMEQPDEVKRAILDRAKALEDQAASDERR